MGKRKSSPRLSATFTSLYIYLPMLEIFIHKVDWLLSFLSLRVATAKIGDGMRVISGTLKGRQLQAVPGNTTRPTTDKVKESLFSMIGPYFDGGICLDLYAGTGSLGIEALSRGMDKGIFIDIDKKAVEIIRANIRSLKLEAQTEVYKNDAERAIHALAKRNLQFDLVFMDPPYAREKNTEIIKKLLDEGLLNRDAVIVVEHDRSRPVISPSDSIKIWKENQFGETSLSIFRYHMDEHIMG